jgi:thiamine-phosphate pyrophosphorylase
VTDRKSLGAGGTTARLLDKIGVAARSGADWVQIREKDLQGGPLLALARQAMNVASAATEAERPAARIYVNDRVDVAIAARAAGVHLGAESLPADETVRWCRRGNAPSAFEVGVSCHSIDGAREAEQNGADYIFFGPVFDTPSKRAFGPPLGTERLREVCREVRIRVIAIGGVNETNAEPCIGVGASGIAAIRMFQERDPLEVREFILRFKTGTYKS